MYRKYKYQIEKNINTGKIIMNSWTLKCDVFSRYANKYSNLNLISAARVRLRQVANGVSNPQRQI
jgi:hypothetical protein